MEPFSGSVSRLSSASRVMSSRWEEVGLTYLNPEKTRGFHANSDSHLTKTTRADS
jgi:hypothetical protein